MAYMHLGEGVRKVAAHWRGSHAPGYILSIKKSGEAHLAVGVLRLTYVSAVENSFEKRDELLGMKLKMIASKT